MTVDSVQNLLFGFVMLKEGTSCKDFTDTLPVLLFTVCIWSLTVAAVCCNDCCCDVLLCITLTVTSSFGTVRIGIYHHSINNIENMNRVGAIDFNSENNVAVYPCQW